MTFGAFLGRNLTNNIAELTAIWKALRLVKHLRKPVKIYSDSEYALKSICGLYKGKKNLKLINDIVEYIETYPVEIEFIKVLGHSGIVFNEFADSIASSILQMAKEGTFKRKKKHCKD